MRPWDKLKLWTEVYGSAVRGAAAECARLVDSVDDEPVHLFATVIADQAVKAADERLKQWLEEQP